MHIPFKKQISNNLVALISLVVAISSLSYNTWRNEVTEHNRNQRFASFEVLLQLGELQQLVFHNHYDQDELGRGNPRAGWARVLTIQDLSEVLGGNAATRSQALQETWSSHWSELGTSQESADAILDSIEDMRKETQSLLKSLE